MLRGTDVGDSLKMEVKTVLECRCLLGCFSMKGYPICIFELTMYIINGSLENENNVNSYYYSIEALPLKYNLFALLTTADGGVWFT